MKNFIKKNMSHNSLNLLIVCNNRNLLDNYLINYKCTYIQSYSEAYDILKFNCFDTFILNRGIYCTNEEKLFLKHISKSFPKLNSIAILGENDIKQSHFLGKNGINDILLNSEFNMLDSLIVKQKNNTKKIIEDLNISINNYPLQLQNILRFIGNEYLSINTVSDIAIHINITECTIIRLFKKNGLNSPKKILIIIKLLHSVEMLINTTCKIKEISFFSGFNNEYIYINCFKRVLAISPTEFKGKDESERYKIITTINKTIYKII
jgi:AraC-like DNA-binding protein